MVTEIPVHVNKCALSVRFEAAATFDLVIDLIAVKLMVQTFREDSWQSQSSMFFAW